MAEGSNEDGAAEKAALFDSLELSNGVKVAGLSLRQVEDNWPVIARILGSAGEAGLTLPSDLVEGFDPSPEAIEWVVSNRPDLVKLLSIATGVPEGDILDWNFNQFLGGVIVLATFNGSVLKNRRTAGAGGDAPAD